MTTIDSLEKKRTTYKPFVPTDDSHHQAFAKAAIDLVIDEFISDLKQLKEEQKGILTYEQWLERGRQIWYKEWWRDKWKEGQKEVEIKKCKFCWSKMIQEWKCLWTGEWFGCWD